MITPVRNVAVDSDMYADFAPDKRLYNADLAPTTTRAADVEYV